MPPVTIDSDSMPWGTGLDVVPPMASPSCYPPTSAIRSSSRCAQTNGPDALATLEAALPNAPQVLAPTFEKQP
jgi:hypothetical protein